MWKLLSVSILLLGDSPMTVSANILTKNPQFFHWLLQRMVMTKKTTKNVQKYSKHLPFFSTFFLQPKCSSKRNVIDKQILVHIGPKKSLIFRCVNWIDISNGLHISVLGDQLGMLWRRMPPNERFWIRTIFFCHYWSSEWYDFSGDSFFALFIFQPFIPFTILSCSNYSYITLARVASKKSGSSRTNFKPKQRFCLFNCCKLFSFLELALFWGM